MPSRCHQAVGVFIPEAGSPRSMRIMRKLRTEWMRGRPEDEEVMEDTAVRFVVAWLESYLIYEPAPINTKEE